MDWFTPIDIYCERVGTAFWAEPLNAISNISFILAAIWGWVEARRRDRLDLMTGILILLAAMIGVGSFLFHTYANVWSSLTDVVPIWTFVFLFVLVAMRRVAGVNPGKIGIGIAIVLAVVAIIFASGEGANNDPAQPDTITAESVQEHSHSDGHTHAHERENSLFNGSEQYLPAVLALLAFTFISRKGGHDIAPWVTGATLVFLTSLTFRTVDMHLCGIWPIGTHIMWHLLNGLTIALLFQGLIRSRDMRFAS